MKALRLVFPLLLALAMPLASAQQKKRVKISGEQEKIIEESLQSVNKFIIKDHGVNATFATGEEELLDLTDWLYTQGYMSLKQLENFQSKLKSQRNEQICPEKEGEDDSARYKRCHSALKTYFFEYLKNSIKYKEPFCVGTSELGTAGTCCEGLVKLADKEYKASGSCKTEAKSCSSNGDCCSKVCNMGEGASVGQCAPVMGCFKLNQEGEACPPKSPYCEVPCDPSDPACKKSLACISVDESTGVGGCFSEGRQCESDLDCCSDKCSGGKCAVNRVCMDCAGKGQNARADQQCCPGTYMGKNRKCLEAFPPFGGTWIQGSIKIDRSDVFGKIPGYIAKIAGLVFPRAYAGEEACVVDSAGLTAEQAGAYEACVSQANEAPSTVGAAASTEIKMRACEAKKRGFLNDNKDKDCISETLKSFSDEGSRAEYRKVYNTAVLADVTKSDVKNCEFNSFKDSWIAKSNMGRNAELALMGFEFVHSGKGEDMLISGAELEPGKPGYWGESIFSRAQKIALKLRDNRYELSKKFEAIDKEMKCKCLATFGLDHFKPGTKLGTMPEKSERVSDEEYEAAKLEYENQKLEYDNTELAYEAKQKFFGASCAGESTYVVEDDIKENRDDQVETEGEVNSLTETDKASAGISSEKLIVEWIGLRMDAQMNHFTNNEALEQELLDLSEFIANYPWTDTPTLERKEHKLHDFKVWWRSGLVRLFKQALLLPRLFGDLKGSTYGGAVNQFDAMNAYRQMYESNQFNKPTYNTLLGLFNGNAEVEPNVADVVTKKKHCYKRKLGVCLKRAKNYRRDLLYPYFDNSKIHHPKKDGNRCEINGLPTSCIKSVYTVDHEFEFGELEPIQDHPLLDVPLPITVDAYSAEELESGKTYARMLNDAFVNHALPAMRNTDNKYLGGGKIRRRHYHESLRYKIFTDPVDMRKFAINQGNWQPKKFNDYKSAFIRGVKEYALCRKLKDCAKHSEELVGSNDIGFGNLFETEEDAEEFGRYVYEAHVVYPRMSAGGRIGYPTFGLNAYYATMAYNLRLTGSLALQRYGEVAEMYELYKEDWEKRKGHYKGLGGADQGSGSRNVELSETLWDEVKTLDFANAASVEAFGAKMDSYKESGKYSSAELDAAGSIVNHAIRDHGQKEKAKRYEESQGKTPRGKRRLAAGDSFLESLNNPLGGMPFNVGGENVGAGSNLIAATTKPPLKEKTSSKEKAKSFDPNAFGNQSAPRYSPSNYGQGTSYGSDEDYSNSLNSGLSDTDARAMIEAARSDSSLEEALPGDSIWNVVSKAYKRNLSRVLVLKSDMAGKDKDESAPKKEVISDGQKQELQNLLEGN